MSRIVLFKFLPPRAPSSFHKNFGFIYAISAISSVFYNIINIIIFLTNAHSEPVLVTVVAFAKRNRYALGLIRQKVRIILTALVEY